MKFLPTVMLIILALGACSKAKEVPAEPPVSPVVDNTVTRYTDNLRSDMEKAEIAVEKANAAMKEREAEIRTGLQNE